jgi:hypothetical protein
VIQRLIRQDWEAIAGIAAAVAALILHFLHISDINVILLIIVVLMALLLIRDIRREHQTEAEARLDERIMRSLENIEKSIELPEVTLVGPAKLKEESTRFARHAHGEVVWFNMCLSMYKSQEPFDLMLRPFIENPEVKSIKFILKNTERERWGKDVEPKIKACPGCDKVSAPFWRELDDAISYVIVETEEKGKYRALISFWGEPFMAIGIKKNVPRYVLWVGENSSLIDGLKEYVRLRRAA